MPRSRSLPVAVGAIVALICAVAVVMQRAAAPLPADAPFDPADGSLAGLSEPGSREPGAPSVEAAQLSFPDVLAEGDERAPADTLMPAEMMARVPAALAAVSAGRGFQKAARQDPLIAAAMRSPQPKRTPAPEGHPGEFTLHVISYDRAELARAFAAGLRAKGYPAFVLTADIPDRGRSFRVRVGPFATRQLAEASRRKFDAEEQMNTVVMRETQAAGVTQP